MTKASERLRERTVRIVYRCPVCGWIEGPKPDWPCPGYAGEEHPAEPFQEFSVTPTADVRELLEAARDLEDEIAGWGSGESYQRAIFDLADRLREVLARFTAKHGEGEG